MIYTVVLKDKRRFLIDYQCWGFLSFMNMSSMLGWDNTIKALDSKIEYKRQPLSVYMTPSDVECVTFTTIHPVPDELLAHPMYDYVTKLSDGSIRAQLAGIPCDKAMAGLFMLRDVYGVEGGRVLPDPKILYDELLAEGFPLWEAFVMSTVWYKTTYYNGGTVYNTKFDDGSLLCDHRVGDVKRLMNGELPVWVLEPFGHYEEGYPTTQVDEWDDDYDDEDYTGGPISASFCYQSRYTDNALHQVRVDELHPFYSKELFYNYIRSL